MKLVILNNNQVIDVFWDSNLVVHSKLTCRFEELLSQNYEIVIASNQLTFFEHDKIWRDIIKPDNFYTLDDGPHIYDHHRDERIIRMWERIFKRFNLTSPNINANFWPQWREAAEQQGIIIK